MLFCVIPEATGYKQIRKGTGLTNVVSTQKGSWVWQDAVKKAVAALRRNKKTGNLFWKNVGWGAKMSYPQLRHTPATDVHYSAHNAPVDAQDMQLIAQRVGRQHPHVAHRTARYLKLAGRLVKKFPKSENST